MKATKFSSMKNLLVFQFSLIYTLTEYFVYRLLLLNCISQHIYIYVHIYLYMKYIYFKVNARSKFVKS